MNVYMKLYESIWMYTVYVNILKYMNIYYVYYVVYYVAGVFWASPSTVPFGKRDHKGSAGREPCGKVFKKCFNFLNTLQQSVQKFVVNVWTPCSKVFKKLWLIEHFAANCSNIVVMFWTLCGKVFKNLWLIFENFAAKCSKIVVDFWTFKKCGSFLNTLPHGVQKLVVVLSM